MSLWQRRIAVTGAHFGWVFNSLIIGCDSYPFTASERISLLLCVLLLFRAFYNQRFLPSTVLLEEEQKAQSK